MCWVRWSIKDYYWIAAAIAVLSLFLMGLKQTLEGLSKRLAPEEILNFTKFLLLAAVILPTVPNKTFTEFGLNPFKTWLLVVAVGGIPYGSYVLLALARQREGVLLSGVLGGSIGEEGFGAKGGTPVLRRHRGCLCDDVPPSGNSSDAL